MKLHHCLPLCVEYLYEDVVFQVSWSQWLEMQDVQLLFHWNNGNYCLLTYPSVCHLFDCLNMM